MSTAIAGKTIRCSPGRLCAPARRLARRRMANRSPQRRDTHRQANTCDGGSIGPFLIWISKTAADNQQPYNLPRRLASVDGFGFGAIDDDSPAELVVQAPARHAASSRAVDDLMSRPEQNRALKIRAALRSPHFHPCARLRLRPQRAGGC